LDTKLFQRQEENVFRIRITKARMPKKRVRGGAPRIIRPSGSKETSFFEMVFEVVRQIPKGRVTSYGAIAACLGARSSSRMVGWAMNASHQVRPRVPAHRVVNRNGMLTGKHHFDTPQRMEELLKKEGIAVYKDRVVDFKNIFWDPSISGL
jgi:methylated-DNA-protein-cysteine methyltransferase-like protein